MIREQRTFFRMSSIKLKRARRLYVRLVRSKVMLDRTANTLHAVADKAVEAGLYSEKTLIGDVHWSILRYIHKTDMLGDSAGSGITCFYKWFRSNGWNGGLGQRFTRGNGWNQTTGVDHICR